MENTCVKKRGGVKKENWGREISDETETGGFISAAEVTKMFQK